MGLYKTGGGGENVLDVIATAPDIAQKLTINASTTKTINVTQKPKLILAFITSTSSSQVGYGFSVVIDVKNDNSYYFGVNTSGSVVGSQGDLGITASDTKITIVNGSSTINRYYTVVAWY